MSTDTTPAPIGADALRKELIADLREVFYASGQETPQIVRDVIEYADSWLRACIQRGAESAAAGAAHPEAPAPTTWPTDSAPTPEREFAEWLNQRRGFPVSEVFHEIMHKFAARAPAAPARPTTGIWVPTELAERVQETIGEFLMDHGWRQQDMDTSDEFGALLQPFYEGALREADKTQQEILDSVAPKAEPVQQPKSHSKLFCDLKTDEEKSNFFLSGKGYETGVIAAAIQNDVALAYHRCAEYKKAFARQPERVPLTETQLRKLHHIEEFGLFCDYEEFEQIARAIEHSHGISIKKEGSNG